MIVRFLYAAPLIRCLSEKQKPRKIPLEIAVTEDKLPMYSVTTEDDGRGYAATKLPFQVRIFRFWRFRACSWGSLASLARFEKAVSRGEEA